MFPVVSKISTLELHHYAKSTHLQSTTWHCRNFWMNLTLSYPFGFGFFFIFINFNCCTDVSIGGGKPHLSPNLLWAIYTNLVSLNITHGKLSDKKIPKQIRFLLGQLHKIIDIKNYINFEKKCFVIWFTIIFTTIFASPKEHCSVTDVLPPLHFTRLSASYS